MSEVENHTPKTAVQGPQSCRLSCLSTPTELLREVMFPPPHPTPRPRGQEGGACLPTFCSSLERSSHPDFNFKGIRELELRSRGKA